MSSLRYEKSGGGIPSRGDWISVQMVTSGTSEYTVTTKVTSSTATMTREEGKYQLENQMKEGMLFESMTLKETYSATMI
mgnify:CR=1 FL=1